MAQKIISVLNHKGGVGKTTIATNLAGYFVNNNKSVMIGDFDYQQSSQNWLGLRNEELPEILAMDVGNPGKSIHENKTDYIIVDAPAGIRGAPLKKIVHLSNKIIIPLTCGYFDVLSTESFLSEVVSLVKTNPNKSHKCEYCIIGNMCDTSSKIGEQLQRFIEMTGVECPTILDRSQIYAYLSGHGMSIFDTQSDVFETKIAQWEPLIEWIER